MDVLKGSVQQINERSNFLTTIGYLLTVLFIPRVAITFVAQSEFFNKDYFTCNGTSGSEYETLRQQCYAIFATQWPPHYHWFLQLGLSFGVLICFYFPSDYLLKYKKIASKYVEWGYLVQTAIRAVIEIFFIVSQGILYGFEVASTFACSVDSKRITCNAHRVNGRVAMLASMFVISIVVMGLHVADLIWGNWKLKNKKGGLLPVTEDTVKEKFHCERPPEPVEDVIRCDKYTKLEEKLKEENFIVLSGPSGSGKTQLSLLYAKKFIRENKDNICFSFNSTSPEDILFDGKTLIDQCKLNIHTSEEGKDEEDSIDMSKHLWTLLIRIRDTLMKDNTKSLFIFDNATSDTAYIIKEVFHSIKYFVVIITSNDSFVEGFENSVIEVNRYSQEDLKVLTKCHYRFKDDIEPLAEVLEYLPLGIHAACKYSIESGCTIKDLLEQLNDSQSDEPLISLLKMSYKKALEKCKYKEVTFLLGIVAILGPAPIPFDVLDWAIRVSFQDKYLSKSDSTTDKVMDEAKVTDTSSDTTGSQTADEGTAITVTETMTDTTERQIANNETDDTADTVANTSSDTQGSLKANVESDGTADTVTDRTTNVRNHLIDVIKRFHLGTVDTNRPGNNMLRMHNIARSAITKSLGDDQIRYYVELLFLLDDQVDKDTRDNKEFMHFLKLIPHVKHTLETDLPSGEQDNIGIKILQISLEDKLHYMYTQTGLIKYFKKSESKAKKSCYFSIFKMDESNVDDIVRGKLSIEGNFDKEITDKAFIKEKAKMISNKVKEVNIPETPIYFLKELLCTRRLNSEHLEFLKERMESSKTAQRNSTENIKKEFDLPDDHLIAMRYVELVKEEVAISLDRMKKVFLLEFLASILYTHGRMCYYKKKRRSDKKVECEHDLHLALELSLLVEEIGSENGGKTMKMNIATQLLAERSGLLYVDIESKKKDRLLNAKERYECLLADEKKYFEKGLLKILPKDDQFHKRICEKQILKCITCLIEAESPAERETSQREQTRKIQKLYKEGCTVVKQLLNDIDDQNNHEKAEAYIQFAKLEMRMIKTSNCCRGSHISEAITNYEKALELESEQNPGFKKDIKIDALYGISKALYQRAKKGDKEKAEKHAMDAIEMCSKEKIKKDIREELQQLLGKMKSQSEHIIHWNSP